MRDCHRAAKSFLGEIWGTGMTEPHPGPHTECGLPFGGLSLPTDTVGGGPGTTLASVLHIVLLKLGHLSWLCRDCQSGRG